MFSPSTFGFYRARYSAAAKLAGWRVPHSPIRPAYLSGCVWAVGQGHLAKSRWTKNEWSEVTPQKAMEHNTDRILAGIFLGNILYPNKLPQGLYCRGPRSTLLEERWFQLIARWKEHLTLNHLATCTKWEVESHVNRWEKKNRLVQEYFHQLYDSGERIHPDRDANDKRTAGPLYSRKNTVHLDISPSHDLSWDIIL